MVKLITGVLQLGIYSGTRLKTFYGPREDANGPREDANLVPRACDPWEGNEGSGIIRFREESDWPLK